jgi:hypothetical protein
MTLVWLLSSILTVLCWATLATGTPQQQPPQLNRFCGAHIANPPLFPQCNYLLQAAYGSTLPAIKETFLMLYKTPPLPSLGPNLVPSNIPASPAAVTTTTRRFPSSFTVPLPYCARFPLRYAAAASGQQVLLRNNNDPSVLSTHAISAPPQNCTRNKLLLNYRPICASTSSILLDMNCDDSSLSYTECINKQLLQRPITPSTSTLLTLNVTQAYVAAVSERLTRSGFTVVPPDADTLCSGTRYWNQLYGNSFPTTLNSGIPKQDVGSPSPFAGTLTWLKPQDGGCDAVSVPDDFITFSISGLSEQSINNTAPAIVQYDENDDTTQRHVYIPWMSCEPSLARPTAASVLTPEITLQPYCRSVGRKTSILPPGYMPLKSGGLYSPANLFDNSVVYTLSASGLPSGGVSPDIGVWALVKFEYPTNPALNKEFGPFVLGPADRVFVSDPQDLAIVPDQPLVYIKRFSPSNPWTLEWRQAQVSVIPACSCLASTNYQANVVCDSNAALNIQLNRPIPFTYSIMRKVMGEVPACDLSLTNGFQNASDAILASGVYNVDAVVTTTANIPSYRWSVLSAAPGAFTFLGPVSNVLSTSFRVSANSVSSITITMNISQSGPDDSLRGECSLTLKVYQGFPVAIVAPNNVLLSPGMSVVLNASRSYSTTGEYLTWSWSVLYASTEQGITLAQTGNQSTTTITAFETGSYVINVRVANPRNFVTASVRVRVVPSSAAGNSTELPSICIPNIGNDNAVNPDLPPLDENSVTRRRLLPPQQSALIYTPDQSGAQYRQQTTQQDNTVVDEDGFLTVDAATKFLVSLIFSVFGLALFFIAVAFFVHCARQCRTGRLYK